MLYDGEKYSQQNYYNVDMSVRTNKRRSAFACDRVPPSGHPAPAAAREQRLTAPLAACPRLRRTSLPRRTMRLQSS